MRLILKNPTTFKDFLIYLNNFNSETIINFKKEEIKINTTSVCNTTGIAFVLNKQATTEYLLESEEEIGILLQDYIKILKTIKKEEILTLETTTDNRLKTTIEGTRKRIYYSPLIDITETVRQKDFSKIKIPLKISTKTELIKDSITEISDDIETVQFVVEQNKFYLQTKQELKESIVEFKQEDIIIETETKTETETNHKTKYSTTLLKNIFKYTPTPNLSFRFANDNLIKFSYKKQDEFKLEILLAPRLYND